jgi:hypothetical protein
MNVQRRYRCEEPHCESSFSRKWNLTRHQLRYHRDSYNESCLLCQKVFTENRKLQEHLITDHGPSEQFILKDSAFEETVVKYRLTFGDEEFNFNNAQNKIIEEIKKTIRFEAAKKTVVKVNLVYICQMSMQSINDEKTQVVLIPFRSSSFIANALGNSRLSIKIRKAFKQQENWMEDFCDSGSNWQFDRAVAFDIEMAGVKPLVVGSRIVKKSSKKFKRRNRRNRLKHQKYLYDPDNKDDKCFLYCVHFLLKEVENFEDWEKNLNLKGIDFPIDIRQIKKFIRQNPDLDLKINILYRTTSERVFPFECGLGEGRRTINLLMIEKAPSKDLITKSIQHFMGVTNVNKYLTQRYYSPFSSKFSYSNCKFCLHCLNRFNSKTDLEKHERICHTKRVTLEEVPPKGSMISFDNYKYQHMQNFIGFLDFECLLSPNSQIQRCVDCKSTRCKCDKSFTEIINHQDPFAYSFVIINSENRIVHEKTYVGENAASHFIDHLLDCWDTWIVKALFYSKNMIFTPEDEQLFDSSETCYLCNKKFHPDADNQDLIKNRDHDHFTGLFLGAACTSCNLSRRRQRSIPIFLHNGSKYDFHFIIRALDHKKVDEIKILPYNGEHFRTIQIKGFKFLDSLAFLQASLSQLSNDLSKTDHSYNILKQTFLCKTKNKFDPLKFEMLLKKSYYPYEYCTDLKLMQNTKKLPKIKAFYSTLREESIDKKEHQVAQEVWRIFECQNLIDYTKIYCKLDTILLAEIFQKFRSDMHNFSNLDPSHYISLPSFAFDSMLRLTNCSLELMSDINMIQFIESSIRGGVSFINTRFLETVKNDPGEIVYIDANVSIINFLFTILRY